MAPPKRLRHSTVLMETHTHTHTQSKHLKNLGAPRSQLVLGLHSPPAPALRRPVLFPAGSLIK